METHRPDPTSDGGKGAWEAFAEDLSSLGRHLRGTYEEIAGEEGPSEEEIRQAFATLSAAWESLAASLPTVIGDPETRSQLKQAVSSLAGALGDTVSFLREDAAASSPDGTGSESDDHPGR